MVQQMQPRDHWTANAYSASASFVPELTTTVMSWLDPQPEDVILDLGCGDGILTARIKDCCDAVTGVDSSMNLIKAAQSSYGSNEKLEWFIQDCRYLEGSPVLEDGRYTKVFSNAALHWILRDPQTRKSVFRSAYKALRRGGCFVFEMGGAGRRCQHSLIFVLIEQVTSPRFMEPSSLR